jgi:hypothetical protein
MVTKVESGVRSQKIEMLGIALSVNPYYLAPVFDFDARALVGAS